MKNRYMVLVTKNQETDMWIIQTTNLQINYLIQLYMRYGWGIEVALIQS